MLAFELGGTGWLLGFSAGIGQAVIRRKVSSRDREGVLAAIEWTREKLDCAAARIVSCYEAGRSPCVLRRRARWQVVRSDRCPLSVNLNPPHRRLRSSMISSLLLRSEGAKA
jgi:hypothetical protein